MLIHRTQVKSGYGKQNYFYNEYRLEGDVVVKYRCNRRKHFDGHENEWVETEKVDQSWALSDESLPDWLRQKL